MNRKPRISRRQILRGLGGFTLALPLLPSLFTPEEAKADSVPGTKRFINICTNHGGAWARNMFPTMVNPDKQTYAGREIRRMTLTPTTSGGSTVLSPVLTAASSVLTPALVAKMNAIQGLDVPFYIAHNTGVHLGNFARNDGNGSDGTYAQGFPSRTIDQIMAWSSAFYPDLSTIKQRELIVGDRISWNYSNPDGKTGPIQDVQGSKSALDLFNQIFVSQTTPQRMPVVDQVYADYKRLHDGNTRISADDRRRLDDHMQRLSELERRLNAKVSCGSVKQVTMDTGPLEAQPNFDISPDLQKQEYQLFNDVIVAAITCSTSRIAAMMVDPIFSDYVGDWHQSIAHHASDPDGVAQKTLYESYQRVFENVLVDLAAKLDVEDGTGMTYLDNTLLAWTQECGNFTHESASVPVITFGSAGGFLKTGNYADYRNLGVVADNGTGNPGDEKSYPGLLWHQWLGTALQAMGIPKAEYESGGTGGYPSLKYVGTNFWGPNPPSVMYPDALWSYTTNTLPYVT